MTKHLKTVFLALCCLLFSGIAMAETYYKIQVLSTTPYKYKYVVSSPQPVLVGKNQTLQTTGIAPPVVQYYVRKPVRTILGFTTYRYVKAIPNPIIPAANQQIVNNPSNLEVQQGFANQNPPPGTPTPPPTTPQPIDDQTPILTQFTSRPPQNFRVACKGQSEICTIPPGKKATVWYGVASKWHKKSWQQGDVPCNNSTFGGDPIPTTPNTYKRCVYVEQQYLDRTVLDNAGVNLAPSVNLSLAPPPNVGFPDAKIRAAEIPPQNSLPYAGAFRISCNFAFMSNDDPIVFPGVPNATHHHTFFGNTAVNAFSTNESLRASGNSTCAGGILNRSGYWMPSLINTSNGAPQRPEVIVVYYKAADEKNGPFTTAPPAGLRMVAGKPRPLAIADTQASYSCQDQRFFNDAPNYGILWRGPSLQACGGPNEMLRMEISFPQCWDGKNLDSPDHISHMAYSCGNECEDANGNIVNTANSCPASHPIAIPSIAINADFRNLDKSATYRLSSDNYTTSQPGGYSLHADWMNGWDQSIIQRMVTNCLVGLRNCGGPNLGDGQMLWGVNTE